MEANNKSVIQRKDAFYFSHDANARNDLKLLKVRRDHGAAGYGIYFMIVEMLRDQQDYRLPTSSIVDIAFDLRVTDEIVKAIINDYDLFEIDDDYFCSARLCRTMNHYNTKKIKLQEAGRRGAQARLKPGSGIAQAKRREDTIVKDNKIKKNKGHDIDSEFESFWVLYDKKKGKELALKYWRILNQKEKALVMEYIPKYKQSQEDKKYRKDPANFLKNKCFNDEIIERTSGKPFTGSTQTRDDSLEQLIYGGR